MLGFIVAWLKWSVLLCPFCPEAKMTLGEEFAGARIVALVRRIDQTKGAANALPGPSRADADSSRSEFIVTRFLKGDDLLDGQREMKVALPTPATDSTDNLYLVLRHDVDVPHGLESAWTRPVALTRRSASFVAQVASFDFPVKPPRDADESEKLAYRERYAKRLTFFQANFEDPELLIRDDVYNEFGRAPYPVIQLLADDLDREKLKEFIVDYDAIPAYRRRLYLTLLGVCATQEDLPLLEDLLSPASQRERMENRLILDALLATYLLVRREEGLERVEEQYLANRAAEHTAVIGAIGALRFHGGSVGVIPTSRLAKSLRLVLDRPEFADLVIPDLARWEDWSVVEKLSRMFRESTDATQWIRVPIVRYLQVCPESRAKSILAELTELDPESVERAKFLSPIHPTQSQSGDDASQLLEVDSAADNVRRPPAGPHDTVVDTPAAIPQWIGWPLATILVLLAAVFAVRRK